MRLEAIDLLGELTALDKLIEAQIELVEELKLDLNNPDYTFSSEMMQLRELSEQIIVLRHLRQTRFEMESNFRLLKSELFGPLLEQQAS
jgi:hypothetical protein